MKKPPLSAIDLIKMEHQIVPMFPYEQVPSHPSHIHYIITIIKILYISSFFILFNFFFLHFFSQSNHSFFFFSYFLLSVYSNRFCFKNCFSFKKTHIVSTFFDHFFIMFFCLFSQCFVFTTPHIHSTQGKIFTQKNFSQKISTKMCSQKKIMCVNPVELSHNTHIQIKLSHNFIKIVNHLGDNKNVKRAAAPTTKSTIKSSTKSGSINNNKQQQAIHFN